MNSKWLGGERQYFIQKKECGDFPGGPAAKNPPSHGGGTKIPHAVKQLSTPPTPATASTEPVLRNKEPVHGDGDPAQPKGKTKEYEG